MQLSCCVFIVLNDFITVDSRHPVVLNTEYSIVHSTPCPQKSMCTQYLLTTEAAVHYFNMICQSVCDNMSVTKVAITTNEQVPILET